MIITPKQFYADVWEMFIKACQEEGVDPVVLANKLITGKQ